MPNFKLYEHQDAAMQFIKNKQRIPKAWGLLMEQGTGKTPVEIHDAAARWRAGEVNGMLVLAPNGVHSNWVRREIPKHMPSDVKFECAAYNAGANKSDKLAMEKMLAAPSESLHIMAVNWESLATEGGFKAAQEFCEKYAGRLKASADESHWIKNPSSERYKALNRIRRFTSVRTIDTGTMILKSPWDAFSQFSWLDQSILGTTSFSAFRAEYAELLPPTSGLMMKLAKTTRFPPQIVMKDADGNPRWRNLERLEALIAPHVFRVLKKDCLDLPEKIRVQRSYQMLPKQRAMYERLEDELRLMLTSGEDTVVSRIGAITKLAQICSGFFLVPGTNEPQWLMPATKNPKLAAFVDELETCMEMGEQVIVWARFQAELQLLASVFKSKGWPFVEYHGGVKNKEVRQTNINEFEDGRARIFSSQQAAGGTGLTLIAPKSIAKTMSVLYYSNTFALGDREQSEDRPHRIGQEKSVRYVDFIGEDCIEGATLENLEAKRDVAAIISGDTRRALEAFLNFR